MKRTDLAYAAGIIDGEGCIGLYHTQNQKQPKGWYEVRISVHHTNEWLTQWFKFAFGGYVYNLKYSNHPEWKNQTQWIVTGRKALDFLLLVKPYLRLKQPQAEIAIQVLAHHAKPTKRSEEQLAVLEAQRIIMSKMNKRGVVKGGTLS